MPIDPPPGLLDKVAEAMHDAYEIAAAKSGWRTNPESRKPWPDIPESNKAATRASARAAWDAMAEGLGLREEVHPFPVVGQRPRTAQDSGLVLDDTPVSVIERWTVARRLVSKWEPQP